MNLRQLQERSSTVIDLLIIAGALLLAVVIFAQLGTDSRDGYGDDHQRASVA